MMHPSGPQSLPSTISRITRQKLLVVEGRDASEFFEALLRHLNLATEIEVRDFGGVSELRRYLRTLVLTPGFTNVVSLGIIRDAEADATSAFQSVCNSLSQSGLSVPRLPMVIVESKPRVTVFILPDCESPGMLEKLCLQTVSNDTAMPCVEQYFQCLQQRRRTLPTNLPKAQLHTFLASRPKSNLRLGEAAHAGYWPWEDPAFDKLKEFLCAL